MRHVYLSLLGILFTITISGQIVHADNQPPTKEQISTMSKTDVESNININSKKSSDLQKQLQTLNQQLDKSKNKANKDSQSYSASTQSSKDENDTLIAITNNLNQVTTEANRQKTKIHSMIENLNNGVVITNRQFERLLSGKNPQNDSINNIVIINKINTSEISKLLRLQKIKNDLTIEQKSQRALVAQMTYFNNSNKSVFDDSKVDANKAKENRDNLQKQIDNLSTSSQELSDRLSSLNSAQAEKIRDSINTQKARNITYQNNKRIQEIRKSLGNQGITGSKQDVLAYAISTNKFVAEVASHLGTPYVWGGESLSGFDCSGLVQYSANKVGVYVPRVSQEQSLTGSSVGFDSLQVGDLLFFGGRGTAYHVVIYIGGGYYIHAPKPGDVVKIGSINGWTPDSAQRISGLSGKTK